jgi:hypothetical protein
MKESMPSRVQPDQAAQKPVICPRDSFVCGCAAATDALDMLLMALSSWHRCIGYFPNVPRWRIRLGSGGLPMTRAEAQGNLTAKGG